MNYLISYSLFHLEIHLENHNVYWFLCELVYLLELIDLLDFIDVLT